MSGISPLLLPKPLNHRRNLTTFSRTPRRTPTTSTNSRNCPMATLTTDTTEKGLESLIVESLVREAGYVQGRPDDFDRDHAIDLLKLLAFLRATQPRAVDALALDQ